jgi:hypothetical protein
VTALADVLRRAYAERHLDPTIAETEESITVAGNGYRLTCSTVDGLTIAVAGRISRDAYYSLALADEQTEGAISAALSRSGYRVASEQVRYSLDAIQAGRGPIYQKGEMT